MMAGGGRQLRKWLVGLPGLEPGTDLLQGPEPWSQVAEHRVGERARRHLPGGFSSGINSAELGDGDVEITGHRRWRTRRLEALLHERIHANCTSDDTEDGDQQEPRNGTQRAGRVTKRASPPRRRRRYLRCLGRRAVRRRGTSRAIERSKCDPIRPSRGRPPRLGERRPAGARIRALSSWPPAPTVQAPTPCVSQV
jgi:hypothetical protein